MKNHISVTGSLGAGKSTVCALLRDNYGFEIYSTGAIQRDIAAKMGITTLELNERMKTDCTLDHVIDDGTTRISIEKADKKILFDSRMAWHFAVSSYKVFVAVDPSIAAKRVLGDMTRGSVENYKSASEAKIELMKRGSVENIRFKEIYKVDNFDYANYDLVIDSSYATPEFVKSVIYNNYLSSDFPRLLFSPRSLYPTLPVGNDEESEVRIARRDGYHYIISGHKTVIDAVKAGKKLIPVSLDCDSGKSVSEEEIHKYENECGFSFASLPNIYD